MRVFSGNKIYVTSGPGVHQEAKILDYVASLDFKDVKACFLLLLQYCRVERHTRVMSLEYGAGVHQEAWILDYVASLDFKDVKVCYLFLFLCYSQAQS